jgi:hypothetical protein
MIAFDFPLWLLRIDLLVRAQNCPFARELTSAAGPSLAYQARMTCSRRKARRRGLPAQRRRGVTVRALNAGRWETQTARQARRTAGRGRLELVALALRERGPSAGTAGLAQRTPRAVSARASTQNR